MTESTYDRLIDGPRPQTVQEWTRWFLVASDGWSQWGVLPPTLFLMPSGEGINVGPDCGPRAQDHAVIVPGGACLQNWGFSPEICEAVDQGSRYKAMHELLAAACAIRVHFGSHEIGLEGPFVWSKEQRRAALNAATEWRIPLRGTYRETPDGEVVPFQFTAAEAFTKFSRS